jgi:hypothetical protein
MMARAWAVRYYDDTHAYSIPLHDDGVEYPPDPIEVLEGLLWGDLDA